MIAREKASFAPDFSVDDGEGHRLRLSDYKDKKNILLVFNRGFT
jgi:peroxiredoxin